MILFIVLAVIAIVSGVAVIAAKSPVRSALALVVNFLALAVIYFSMNLHLIGISQVLVYTGLIMMLFLFCILLLNLGAPQMLTEKSSLKRWVAYLVAGSLIVVLFSQTIGPLLIANGPTAPFGATTPSAPEDFGTAKAIGNTLFNHWVYGFEIASVLLLVGIVGSILLAKRRA
ncbi:MAG: NADH-quinone oxidoreductase subunit J [Fimbriimonadales bacterium]